MGIVYMTGGGGYSGSDDCTATPSNWLKGKTAIGKGTNDDPVVGTMPDNSSRTSNGNVPGINSSYPNVPTREGTSFQMAVATDGVNRMSIGVPQGYYPDPSSSYINRPASELGGATAAQVLQGATFTSTSGIKVTGTMPNRGQYQTGGFGEGSDYYAINNLPQGYYSTGSGAGWAPEARCPKSTVRKYLGCTDPSKWVQGTTIAGQNGTMANVASIDPAKSVVYNSNLLYIRMTNGAHITNAASGYPEVSLKASDAISALGVQNLINFSLTRTGHSRVRVNFGSPTANGLWSGSRIVGKAGSTPTSAEDGTIKSDCSTVKQSQTVYFDINENAWYFRVYGYVTYTGGRVYGGYFDAKLEAWSCNCNTKCNCDDECSCDDYTPCSCNRDCPSQCTGKTCGPADVS